MHVEKKCKETGGDYQQWNAEKNKRKGTVFPEKKMVIDYDIKCFGKLNVIHVWFTSASTLMYIFLLLSTQSCAVKSEIAVNAKTILCF